MALSRVASIAACVALGCATTPPKPPARAPAPTPYQADAETIDRFVAERVHEEKLLGLSVAVMRDGKVVLARGYGLRSLTSGAAVEPDTMFAIGSVTKQFTAAAILLLAEDGKLAVTDPVARWFPTLTRAREITLLDLMNHASGYRDYYPLDFVDRRMRTQIAPEELVRRYAGGPLDFEPGTRHSYSNTGYVVLGLVVEKVSGEPFGAFLARRIFDPLGMAHTRYEPEPGSAGLAEGYGSFALGNPEAVAAEAKGWLGAAGGIWSTASDLARWDLALATGKVLGPESFRILTTPRRLASGATVSYGGGVGIASKGSALVLSHVGEVAGFSARNTLMPASRSAVVLLANSERHGALERIAAPLVAAAMPPPDVPSVSGPDPVEAARRMFLRLQAGSVDRRAIGDEFSAYLTDERLRGAAEMLGPWGAPSDVKLVSMWERGGMEACDLQLTFEKGTLEASMYRRPDGKIEQFLVSER